MLAAAGLEHPDQLKPHHLVAPREPHCRCASSVELHEFLAAGRAAGRHACEDRGLCRQLEARLGGYLRGLRPG